MIFDKRRFIAALESSTSFIIINTTFFVLILCNIWFPYTLQNEVNNISMRVSTNVTQLPATTASETKTIYNNSSSKTTGVPSATSASLHTYADTISLLKKDIYQSVSQIESVGLKQAHAYINNTIYFLNDSCLRNTNFSREQLGIINNEISLTLKNKSKEINLVIEKINGSSVSVDLGTDTDSNSVNQTDLQNLKINYSEFSSSFKNEEKAFEKWFNINNLVNLTTFENVRNTNKFYNLTLNSTQSTTIDLLLKGYFAEMTKSKREYGFNNDKSVKTNYKKSVISLTIFACLSYVIGIMIYFVMMFLFKKKKEEVIITNWNNENAFKSTIKNINPKYNRLINFISNIFTFLKKNSCLTMFWVMLIIEYSFVKHHVRIFFDSEVITKREYLLGKNSDFAQFSNTLSNNVESFVTFNLFDDQEGMIVTYVDELGIQSVDLKTNILNTLKQIISTSYNTSTNLEDLIKNSKLRLLKRQLPAPNLELDDFFIIAKNVILKYIRFLIIIISVFIIVQLLIYELCIYHSQ